MPSETPAQDRPTEDELAAGYQQLAEAGWSGRLRRTYVRVETSVPAYRDPRCADCRQPLIPVVASDVLVDATATGEAGAEAEAPGPVGPVWRSLQAVGALHLHLSGGYGEFVDVDASEAHDLHLVLCEGCAVRLTENVPYLAAALAPFRSDTVVSGEHVVAVAASQDGTGRPA